MDRKPDPNRKLILHTQIASIILAICIGTLAIIYNIMARNQTVQTCYTTLSDASDEACSKIESNFENDRSSLRMLAKIISKSDNMRSNEVNNQLATYAVNSYITNIAIAVPDGSIIQSRHINTSGTIDYDAEIAKGEHISSLQPSAFIDGKHVIRNYMPIRASIESKGILFTEMDPVALARAWKPNMYNGNTQFCIIDRATGEILISDWRTDCKNINETNIPVTDSILNGESGYADLKLQDETVIVSYRPMHIEQWEIMFIIDDDVVFKNEKKLRNNLLLFLTIGAVITAAYISWIIRQSLKAVHEAKRAGNIDVLTGLPNRNSYEEHCASLAKNPNNIACVYIDANGLHEINNEKGHLAGDMMLRFITETLKLELKDADIYRIGGDEFIAFLYDRYDTNSAMHEVTKSITKNGYHISYGIAINNGEPITETIKTAETLMYNMKKEYYAAMGKSMRNKKEK